MSALLFLAAFPPLDLAPLVLVCFVPWLITLWRVTPTQAFRTGYLMGFIIVFVQMAWTVKLVWAWTANPWISILPVVVCGFLGAFYFAFAGWLLQAMLRTRFRWLAPIVYAGIEVGRSYIPLLAFPWFLLGDPLVRWPALVQSAGLGSVYLISALAMLVNVAIAWCIVERPKAARVWPWAIAPAAAVLYSVWRYQLPIEGRERTIAIGQPAVDMAFGPSPETREFRLAMSIDSLVAQAERMHPDLLVLPEGMSRSQAYPPQPGFHIPRDFPVIFGGRRGMSPAHQSAFAHFQGKWAYADKTRLVVFGEYVPGRDILPFLGAFHLPSSDFEPGAEVSAVQTSDMRIGPLICFEALFWDIAYKQAQNRSELLAVMSIDDWYMGTPAPAQLARSTSWRCIETGLPAVRSASLGHTLACDQRGRVVDELPVGSSGLLRVKLRLAPSTPLFTVLLFPILSAVTPFALTVAIWWKRKKKPGAEHPASYSLT